MIGRRVVKLAGGAVAAIVERDGATPCAREGRYPARRDPIDLFVRGEAVHEHNRLALPFIQKGDVEALMLKLWHARTIRSGVCMEKMKPIHRRQASAALLADKCWS